MKRYRFFECGQQVHTFLHFHTAIAKLIDTHESGGYIVSVEIRRDEQHLTTDHERHTHTDTRTHEPSLRT